ncbi:MAG TPA: carboxypeptidase-like regulatory domain-containing protein, partial [Verrucomicrobiae bacterium]
RIVLIHAICILTLVTQAGAANFQPLNLTNYLRRNFSNAAPELGALPTGPQNFAGIPYQLAGRIELTGMDAAEHGEFLPTQVSGIPVQRTAARLHLLHAALHGQKDGTPLANLVLHYKNGESRVLRVAFGLHARNALGPTNNSSATLEDPNSGIAWQSEPSAGPTGMVARIYHTVLGNPLPGEEIETLDYVSLFSRATPILFAITLQDGANLPALAELPRKKIVQHAFQFPDSTYRRELRLHITGEATPALGSNARAALTIQDDLRAFSFGQYEPDATGHLTLFYPPTYAAALTLRVSSPGYAPEMVTYSTKAAQKWPEQLDVVLKRGLTIGGVIVDGAGKPIADANVIPYQLQQTASNQFTRSDLDLLKTAADGTWRAAAHKEAVTNLILEVIHPDYHSTNVIFPVTELLTSTTRTVLQPHIHVEGIVMNSQGAGVGKAMVVLDHLEGRRTQFTDNNGRFSIPVRDPTNTSGTLLVMAKDYAPGFQTVSMSSGLGPFKIQLDQGSNFTMRILDQKRQPIPGVKVSLDEWMTSQELRWTNYTDAQGRFTWEHAPKGEVTFRLDKAGYGSHYHSVMLPFAGELDFNYPRRLSLAGRVLDAVSNKAVDQFRVRVRYKYSNNSGSGSGSTTGRKGNFSYSMSTMNYDEISFTIEAKGYQPILQTVDLSSGSLSNIYYLQKAKLIPIFVNSQAGKPVLGAEVILLDQSGNATLTQTGKFQKNLYYYDVATTDGKGLAELTPKVQPDFILASHPTFGFAQMPADEAIKAGKITLQPWGHVRGVLKVGNKLDPTQYGALNSLYIYDQSRQRSGLPLYLYFKSKPEPDGSFAFDFVPPGWRSVCVSYQYTANSGNTHNSHGVAVEVKPGETNHVVVGGNGRTVKGKAVVSGYDAAEINWQNYNQTLRPQQPPRMLGGLAAIVSPVSPLEQAKWNNTTYELIFEPDGSFQVPNVPPGSYYLQLTPSMGTRNTSYRSVGNFYQQISIPEGTGPYDLGTLDVRGNGR